MISKTTDFFIVNFLYFDGDISTSTSNGVNMPQRIPFARVSIHVTNYNARNKILTAKLIQQGSRYHKLQKLIIVIADTMNCHYEVKLKSLLHQGLSES